MSEVQRLQDRIEELEGILGIGEDDALIYRSAFAVTPSQARLLGLIARRNVTVTYDGAIAVLYGDKPECDYPTSHILSVLVCKLRKKLNPFGIEIRTNRAVGYYMAPDDREKLRAVVQERTGRSA